MQQHMTSIYDDISEKGIRETPPGMAHWTGTGPKGKVCRECVHYVSDARYSANSPGHAKNQLKPGWCKKTKELQGGMKGPVFPTESKACRHFEESPNPPVFVERRYA